MRMCVFVCVFVKLMSGGRRCTQERLGGAVSEKQTIDVIYPTLIFYSPRRIESREEGIGKGCGGGAGGSPGRATETHKGKESFREGPASVVPQRRSREKERR